MLLAVGAALIAVGFVIPGEAGVPYIIAGGVLVGVGLARAST